MDIVEKTEAIKDALSDAREAKRDLERCGHTSAARDCNEFIAACLKELSNLNPEWEKQITHGE